MTITEAEFVEFLRTYVQNMLTTIFEGEQARLDAIIIEKDQSNNYINKIISGMTLLEKIIRGSEQYQTLVANAPEDAKNHLETIIELFLTFRTLLYIEGQGLQIESYGTKADIVSRLDKETIKFAKAMVKNKTDDDLAALMESIRNKTSSESPQPYASPPLPGSPPASPASPSAAPTEPASFAIPYKAPSEWALLPHIKPTTEKQRVIRSAYVDDHPHEQQGYYHHQTGRYIPSHSELMQHLDTVAKKDRARWNIRFSGYYN